MNTGYLMLALAYFILWEARSLAISGSSRHKGHGQTPADVLMNPQSFFQTFHQLIHPHNSLQLRSYSDATPINPISNGEQPTPLAKIRSNLWIKERVPESLNLSQLKQLLNHYQISWSAPAFANQQRDVSPFGFAELVLTEPDLKKLLISPSLFPNKATLQHIAETSHIEGYLQEWLLNRKETIAAKGSEQYQAPKPEELVFF